MKCIHCNDKKNSLQSLRSHERLCKKNPVRAKSPFEDIIWQKEKGTNQFIKAKQDGTSITMSDATKKKISDSRKGSTITDDHKKALSAAAKRNGLGGITQSRWITYKGKKLGSSYEYEVALDLDKHNIKWDTCKKFYYIDPYGNVRRYTPDLYLPDYDIYLDPKNDFLINNINPKIGYSDTEKIKLVENQNNLCIIILSKNELTWSSIEKKIKEKRVL
jgi:hypothetical protein